MGKTLLFAYSCFFHSHYISIIYIYTFWVTYTHTHWHREMVLLYTCQHLESIVLEVLDCLLWSCTHVGMYLHCRKCGMYIMYSMFEDFARCSIHLLDMFKVEGNNYNLFNCKITVGKSCFCEIEACQNAHAVFNPPGCFYHAYILCPPFSSIDGVKLLFSLLCNYPSLYVTVFNNSPLWPRITSTGFLKTVHEKCPGASWRIGWQANQCSFCRRSFDRKWLAQVYGYAYDDGMGLMRCSSATHYTVSWRLIE